MVIYSIKSTGITFEQYTSYFIYYLIAIAGFDLTGIIILYLLKTKDIIREIPVFQCLIMEIWVCQYVFCLWFKWFGVSAASISAL